jgi:hypothetical protein
MREYIPDIGMEITQAARNAILLAKAYQEPVSFKFNDVPLEVDADCDPVAVAGKYATVCAERAEAYRKSPEGIAAAERRSREVVDKQLKCDQLVAYLPVIHTITEVVYWLDKYTEVADDVGVDASQRLVLQILEDKGYVANEHVGQPPGWFCFQDRLGRYIVGQAMECLFKGMPPHPVLRTFVDKYRTMSATTSV